MPLVSTETLDSIFTYHRPTPRQGEKYVRIRDAAKNVAYCVLHNAREDVRGRAFETFKQAISEGCPPSHEKDVALTNVANSAQSDGRRMQLRMLELRQAVMWANASIACNEPDADMMDTVARNAVSAGIPAPRIGGPKPDTEPPLAYPGVTERDEGTEQK